MNEKKWGHFKRLLGKQQAHKYLHYSSPIRKRGKEKAWDVIAENFTNLGNSHPNWGTTEFHTGWIQGGTC